MWGGEVDKNCKFIHIPYKCKIEQPATRQRNGIKYMAMRQYEVSIHLPTAHQLFTVRMDQLQPPWDFVTKHR